MSLSPRFRKQREVQVWIDSIYGYVIRRGTPTGLYRITLYGEPVDEGSSLHSAKCRAKMHSQQD